MCVTVFLLFLLLYVAWTLFNVSTLYVQLFLLTFTIFWKKIFVYGFVIFIYVLLLLHVFVCFVPLRLIPNPTLTVTNLWIHGMYVCMYVCTYKNPSKWTPHFPPYRWVHGWKFHRQHFISTCILLRSSVPSQWLHQQVWISLPVFIYQCSQECSFKIHLHVITLQTNHDGLFSMWPRERHCILQAWAHKYTRHNILLVNPFTASSEYTRCIIDWLLHQLRTKFCSPHQPL
jgi:hypothetical protein